MRRIKSYLSYREMRQTEGKSFRVRDIDNVSKHAKITCDYIMTLATDYFLQTIKTVIIWSDA